MWLLGGASAAGAVYCKPLGSGDGVAVTWYDGSVPYCTNRLPCCNGAAGNWYEGNVGVAGDEYCYTGKLGGGGGGKANPPYGSDGCNYEGYVAGGSKVGISGGTLVGMPVAGVAVSNHGEDACTGAEKAGEDSVSAGIATYS